MKTSTAAGILTSFVLVISFVMFVIYGAKKQGNAETRSEMQKEAIEAGVAEYYCDPKTGEVGFRWKKSI